MQQIFKPALCAASLLWFGCEKSASDQGIVPVIGDSGQPDAPAVGEDASVRDPSGASALDASSGLSAPDAGSVARQPDAASSPQRPVGDAGIAKDATTASANVSDAGQEDAAVVEQRDADTDAGPAPAQPTWGDQPCNEESTKPGCNDESLALCICRGPDASGGNDFCCTESWNYLCVDGVASLPECQFTTTKCCEAHPTNGCDDPQIEQCICDEVSRQKQEEIAAGRDPASVHDCCNEGWSDFCAILADSVCNAGCAAP